MNKLTKDEIALYVTEANRATGVDGISREDLESIDLDNVQEVIANGWKITDLNGGPMFKFDHFTQRSQSVYLKPSFAGRQVLLGRVGRELLFSNGRWFSGI